MAQSTGSEDRAASWWPGRRLGLPEDGPGAVATTGSRVAALIVDIMVGALIGGLVNSYLGDTSAVEQSVAVNGAFTLQVLLLQALTGQSIGMRLLRIRVARLSQPDVDVPGLLPVAIRTALLLLILPALVMDRDGRAVHDLAAGTVVLRAKGNRSFAG